MAALTVFLVEDSPLVRLGLIPALRDLIDAEVLATAESESDAIAWLAEHKGGWDLAVVELFLKQGTGMGVVRWTNGRLERQEVAVLTDFATEALRSRCQRAGADAVFNMETELEQFIAFSQELIKSSAADQG